MLFDGELFLNTNSGKLTSTVLKSHVNSPNIELKDQFKILLNLRKYSAAWELCKILNLLEYWNELGQAAISDLEIPFGNAKIAPHSVFMFYKLCCFFLFRSNKSVPFHW